MKALASECPSDLSFISLAIVLSDLGTDTGQYVIWSRTYPRNLTSWNSSHFLQEMRGDPRAFSGFRYAMSLMPHTTLALRDTWLRYERRKRKSNYGKSTCVSCSMGVHTGIVAKKPPHASPNDRIVSSIANA